MVIQEQMKDGLKNYKRDGYDGVTQTWNMIQSDFYCCGVDSYKNWKDDSDFGKSGNLKRNDSVDKLLYAILCFQVMCPTNVAKPGRMVVAKE